MSYFDVKSEEIEKYVGFKVVRNVTYRDKTLLFRGQPITSMIAQDILAVIDKSQLSPIVCDAGTPPDLSKFESYIFESTKEWFNKHYGDCIQQIYIGEHHFMLQAIDSLFERALPVYSQLLARCIGDGEEAEDFFKFIENDNLRLFRTAVLGAVMSVASGTFSNLAIEQLILGLLFFSFKAMCYAYSSKKSSIYEISVEDYKKSIVETYEMFEFIEEVSLQMKKIIMFCHVWENSGSQNIHVGENCSFPTKYKTYTISSIARGSATRISQVARAFVMLTDKKSLSLNNFAALHLMETFRRVIYSSTSIANLKDIVSLARPSEFLTYKGEEVEVNLVSVKDSKISFRVGNELKVLDLRDEDLNEVDLLKLYSWCYL